MFIFSEKDKDAAKTAKSWMSDFLAPWISSNKMDLFDVVHFPNSVLPDKLKQ